MGTALYLLYGAALLFCILNVDVLFSGARIDADDPFNGFELLKKRMDTIEKRIDTLEKRKTSSPLNRLCKLLIAWILWPLIVLCWIRLFVGRDCTLCEWILTQLRNKLKTLEAKGIKDETF